jgi:hypothetical protein
MGVLDGTFKWEKILVVELFTEERPLSFSFSTYDWPASKHICQIVFII